MDKSVAENMLRYLSARDHNLMRRVNCWRPPRWVRLWMICATRGGDGWLWYAVGLCVLLFGGENRFRAIAATVLSAGTGIALFLRVKKWTNRPRPCRIIPSL